MRIQRCIRLLAMLALAAVGLPAQTVDLNLIRPVVLHADSNWTILGLEQDGWVIFGQGPYGPYSKKQIVPIAVEFSAVPQYALHVDLINNFPQVTPGPTGVDENRGKSHRIIKLGVVDPHHPFTLTVRARLTEYDVLRAGTGQLPAWDPSKGFCFLASTGIEEYGFCLALAFADHRGSHPAAVYLVGNVTMPSSTTTDDKYHVYQLEVTPGTGSTLYRDGQLLGKGSNTGSWAPPGYTWKAGQPPQVGEIQNGLFLGHVFPGGLPIGDITDFWYLPNAACAVAAAQPGQ